MAEKKLGRPPKKDSKKGIVTLRIDDRVIDEIDAICKHYSELIGFEVSRMQLIRKLINMGLTAYKGTMMK